MSKLLLGIDAGNYQAKIAGPFGIDSYRTAICAWFERNIVESFGNDDMEFQIGNRKGFAGSIAVYEDEFGEGSMFGDSKAHEDTKIRVLLAIYRYINKYCPGTKDVSLVTGQPITSHKENEKEKIKSMLIGSHEFVVNDVKQHFHIHDVGVAPEGSGAFWSLPQDGVIRIIDIGSGTVNAASVNDRRPLNNASDTFNFGMETVTNKKDLETVARAIIRGTTRLKWKRDDSVFVCGGISKDILPYIAEHYVNAQLLKPQLQERNLLINAEPVFANAIGFYKLAKGTFGEE